MSQVFKKKFRKNTIDRVSQQSFLRQYILIPAIPLFIGFFIGWLSDWRKEVSADERLLLEHQTKIFVATSDQFPSYILSWSRVTEFGQYEWDLVKQSKVLNLNEIAEKNKNLDARRKSKDQLFSTLTTAKMFFGDDVVKQIEEFKTFDKKQSIATVDLLPKTEVWETYSIAILSAMKNEVRTKK